MDNKQSTYCSPEHQALDRQIRPDDYTLYTTVLPYMNNKEISEYYKVHMKTVRDWRRNASI